MPTSSSWRYQLRNNRQKKFILMTYHNPHLAMEFLRSFLRRHFAGKLVVASWNVGCFLKLRAGCRYPDLFRATDWSCHGGNLLQPIRSTTQIWVVTRHQYGISAFVSQTSFRWETSGGVVKCRLFSKATYTSNWAQGEKFLCIQKNRTILITLELDIHQNCRFEAMAKKRRIVKCPQIHMSAKTCSEYWGRRERDNWTGIWQGERNVWMGVINRQLLFLWKWNDQHVTSVGQRKKLSPRQDYSFLFFSFLTEKRVVFVFTLWASDPWRRSSAVGSCLVPSLFFSLYNINGQYWWEKTWLWALRSQA